MYFNIDENGLKRKFNIIFYMIPQKSDEKVFLSLLEYNYYLNQLRSSKLNLNTIGIKQDTIKDNKMVREFDILTVRYLMEKINSSNL